MGHAFISYAHEDSPDADRLQRSLEAVGVRVWRDTKDIGPGEEWRSEIHRAITGNAMVFIACFSSKSLLRSKSYQREELLLAIDELRQRPPGVPWFIPVRFDDCVVPHYDLGAGRTLASLQWTDLFGTRSGQAATRLVATVLAQLGQPALRSAPARPLLTGQELVAHVFAPVHGSAAEDAQAWIRHLWSQCRTGLGMITALRRPELAARLPDDLTATPDPAALAGQQSPDATRQAMLQRSHDILTLSIRLSARDDTGDWLTLSQLLQVTTGDLTGYQPGAAVCYLGQLADPRYLERDTGTDALRVSVTPELESALTALLPPSDLAGLWQHHSRAPGLAFWDISPSENGVSTLRQFITLAPPGSAAEVVEWAWLADGPSMPPLARYLLHTSKIRHELRALSNVPSARQLCQRVDDTVASLRAFVNDGAAHPAGSHGSRRSVDNRQLARLRQDAAQLSGLHDALVGMRLTVAVSHANALRALAQPSSEDEQEGPGPGADADDVSAVALVERLDEDIACLEASLDSVRHITELSQPATTPADRDTPVTAVGRVPSRTPLRAVVLCALNVEYLAVRFHLTSLRQWEHSAGTLFEIGRLPDTNWEVALTVLGPGNVGAGVVAERAISQFRPAIVLFVGVAGALKQFVKLGDVVVATRVDAYQGGRAAEDFLARPRTWDAPYRLDQIAQHLDRTGEWKQWLPAAERDPAPTVHFRPIASGEVVLDSRKSVLFAQLNLHYNDAAAIEMEGAGVAQAAHFNDSLPALVIRGISDLANGKKLTADRAGWQERASQRAAAFAAALLASYAPQSAENRGA
jgi:nucleoside phosphorylase